MKFIAALCGGAAELGCIRRKRVSFVGGQDGNRGYLVQSIIALLESLRDTDWETVRIEPDDVSQKVDILWQRSTGSKAVQVKSSINQIGKADAERWASEVQSGATADNYELVLVGPCAQSVIVMGSFQGVSIRTKNLDVGGLLDEAAHKLDRFIEAEGLDQRSATQRELMVSALTTHLSALSTSSNSLSRAELTNMLKRWISATIPAERKEGKIVIASFRIMKILGGGTCLIANLFNRASHSIEIKSAFIRVDHPCHPPEFQESIQFGISFYHAKGSPFENSLGLDQGQPVDIFRDRSCVVESNRDVYFRLPPQRYQGGAGNSAEEWLSTEDSRFKFIVRSAVAEIGRIEGTQVAWAFKEYLRANVVS